MRGIVVLLILGCGDKTEDDPIVIIEPADESDTDTDTDADTDTDTDTDTDPNDPNNIDDDGDGFTENDGDCNDDHAQIYPGAEDIPDDGIDQDCDGEDTETTFNSVSVDDISAGDLIVTEIMKDPNAVHGEYGEWFEIYNLTEDAINLQGLIVTDAGSDEFEVEDEVMIAPNMYFIFGASGNISENGGVSTDYAYDRGFFALGNSEDEIILSNANIDIDIVMYNDVFFPDSDGYALSLDPDAYDHIANDDGQNWCDAQIAYGNGDYGTPGGTNDACPSLPDADGDGYTSDIDCNDNNPDINPGELDDVCNGVDGNCDGNLDEDWLENDTTGESYEPNESTAAAHQLGTDTSGGSDGDTADLDVAGTITTEAYIFDEADIDTFAFTSYDNYWTDYGFNVYVNSVPSTVDIAIAIDFIDENGILTPDLVIHNDAGAGGSEETCIGDTVSTCGNRHYDSGTWIVRVYSVNSGGQDCSDSYELVIED